MVFSNHPTSQTSQTSCIDCHLKKRWQDFEKNDRRDEKDGKDDFDPPTLAEWKISPWTVCQFEFDEDYLSNGNDDKGERKSIRN